MAETKYVVLIEVDPLVVWRITSKMMEAFVSLKPRIEAVCEKDLAKYKKEYEEWEKSDRKSDPYGINRPHNTGLGTYMIARMEEVRRLHSLARYAKANFRVEESDVRMLESIESGDLERWFEDLLPACEKVHMGDGE